MKDIFSTQEREKILSKVIFRENSVSVNDIASHLKLSKGLVSKYFGILVKKGVLKRTNGKFLVTDSVLVRGIKVLLNVESIDAKLFRQHRFVKAAGLYGSCAKGENAENSDVDLWIRIRETPEEKLAFLTSILNKKIKNAKVIFLTDKKIESIKREDRLFYDSLVFGSLVIYGGKEGIQL